MEETSFLGLDATAWTALATIVALVLGVWGVLGQTILKWWHRPDLKLLFDELDGHYSSIGDGDELWLRVPVLNRGCDPASNVEVFIETISRHGDKDRRNLFPYLPVRLKWTHSEAAVGDVIAGGARRLLELGRLVFHMGWNSGREDLCQNKDNLLLLVFGAEISPLATGFMLPIGEFQIQFLVVCAASESWRSTCLFKIQDQRRDKSAPASKYLSIRPL